MTATATATRIDLTRGHSDPGCLEMAWSLHRQLSRGYERHASILPLDGDQEHYLADHRTARKRAIRARRFGYTFEEIERARYTTDVFDINTSTPERQGRPMTAGYRELPSFGPLPKLCDEHHVYTYGVLRHGRLFAYLWLYRCGDLALVSSILGHAAHLDDGIMFLLLTETLRDQRWFGGTAFYNLHTSGTEGLRWFKERCGFESGDVEWSL